MKVLLFTIEYPPFKGGVANYYENVAKHWLKPDDIFVLANGNIASTNKKTEYKNLISNLIYPKWLFSFYYLFLNILKNKIDHILVGQILPLGLVTYIVSKFTSTKYSTILHGMDFTFALRKKRKRFIAKLILTNSQRIICSNSYVAQLAKDFLGAKYFDKIIVVNPGIDNNFSYDKNIADSLIKKHNLQDKIILLSVGRLVKRKGFDKVVEVIGDVTKTIPNLLYVLAGKGPDEEHIKSFQKDANNILYLNNLSDDEKWAWLALSDIFITASRDIDGDFEGFGIVYLEAYLAGKPVIAGNSGGVSDAVRDNYSGLLINPDDNEEIKKAIITLALNKELRVTLGSQGQKMAIEEFNWQNQINKIYNSIN